MAIQNKGILGTPAGKIRNLNCYTRNGKGIISTVPTVLNPKERQFNLYIQLYIQKLTSLWFNTDGTTKLLWDGIKGAELSGFDAFIKYNLQQAKETLKFNFEDILLSPPWNIKKIDYELTYDYNNQTAIVKYNANSLAANSFVFTTVSLQRINADGRVFSLGFIPVIPGVFEYSRPYLRATAKTDLGFISVIFRASPFKRNQLLIKSPYPLFTQY